MAKSKKDVPAIVSALGVLMSIISALVALVLKRDGTAEDIYRLATPEGEGLLEKFADLIVSAKRAVSKFKVFKTIKLGTCACPVMVIADDFRRALKQDGHRIGDWANDIIGKRAFTAASQEAEVDLVNVSVAELGFPKGATRQDIYRRAQELGLEKCPAEVGPQLRLQYHDQPFGEWLLIGMEPITDSAGSPEVFSVERDGDGSWLSSFHGYPDFFWIGIDRWVFLRRRRTSA